MSCIQIFIWFNIFGIITDILQAETIINSYSIAKYRMPIKYFNQENLTEVTWAHAVNSQKELQDALSSEIDMIEADIVLGKLNNIGKDIPVMGHPPATTSDITLNTFLTTILDYNLNLENSPKGVKLDFKSIEVFEGSLEILEEMWDLMNYPVWLNADIIKGPVNNTQTIPVDSARFLQASKNFPNAVLSIGWTTKWGSNYTEGSYQANEVDDMIKAIQANNLSSTDLKITFPVRAGIAANSQTELHELVKSVNNTNDVTITIWSSTNDSVNIRKLRNLIFSFGLDRVYLDVPKELSNKLELHKGPNNSAMSYFINFSLISICLAIVWSIASQRF